MKKFLAIFLSAIVLVCSCFIVGAQFITPAPAEAETETELTEINNNTSPAEFSRTLYTVLAEIVNANGDLGQGRSFPVEYFKDYPELDLTTGSKATIPALKKESLPKITSLLGLNYLQFDKLKTLTIDGHEIEIIAGDDLLSLGGLKTLNIRNNKLTEINLPVTMTNLNNLDVSGNQLAEIDISTLAMDGSIKPYCNLSKNNFTKASKITLPRTVVLRELNLSFNNLVNTKKSDLATDNTILLLQGYKTGDKLSYGSTIYTVGDNTYPNFNAKVFFSENSSFYTPENANIPVVASDVNGKLVIPCGKITIKFFNGNTLIEDNANFAPINLEIAPPTLVVKGYVGGQEITKLSSKQNINMQASLDLAGTALDDFIKQNTVFKMKLGTDADFIVGSSIDITTIGSHSLVTMISYDGLTSQVELRVEKYDDTGLIWAIIGIVTIIILIISAVYIVNWYKNGAVVAPLTDKETYKLQRRLGYEIKKQIDKDDVIMANSTTETETIEATDDDNEVIE